MTDNKSRRAEIRRAMTEIEDAYDVLDAVLTRLENRLHDDPDVDLWLPVEVENAGWRARDGIQTVTALLRKEFGDSVRYR